MRLSHRIDLSIKGKMANLKLSLSDAFTLAEFSNLKPTEAEHFRQKYPDFLRNEWWMSLNGKQWQVSQELLRQAWLNRFEFNFIFLVQLLFSIYDPDEPGDELNELIFATDAYEKLFGP